VGIPGRSRSAIIVSANIPFALFFAIIILVLQGEDANLLSLGAVDFGIIVDSAVIMMENIYRNFQSTVSIGNPAAASGRRLLGP
jgi:cobalt-zinc-cadmium resistance protein CzcA